MNQNDYVILFDENGQPYIAHGFFSNAKERAHKYIQKIKDSKGWRYFYSQAEWEAYQRARNATVQAQRDLAMTKKVTAEQARTGIRQPDGTLSYNKKDADKAVRNAQQNLDAKRAQENQAKNASSKTLRGQIELMKDEFHNLEQKRAQDRHDKRVAQKQKEAEKLAKKQEQQAQKETKKQKKLDAEQAKVDASNSKHYSYRKEANFRNGSKALWNNDKKNSAYSDENIQNAVQTAFDNDGVKQYTGDNPEIRKSFKMLNDRAKKLEEHKIDLQVAEREATKAKELATRAEEAYAVVYSDKTSSKEAIRTARRLMDQTAKEAEEAVGDLVYLRRVISDEQKSYRSALQMYNTYLYLYDAK